MDDKLSDAQLQIVDIIRGVMLYEAAVDEMQDPAAAEEMGEALGDLIDAIMEALQFKVVSVDGTTVTAQLELEEE